MLLLLLLPLLLQAQTRVHTPLGALDGAEFAGIRIFRGVPFAQPPVGEFRFAPPAPIHAWEGIKDARNFGPRCMQQPLFNDMVFRSRGMSEDCLYLNIWTPAKSPSERFPVLVYFYGGGFQAGDGSEPRYDGAAMARRGIVTITVNYRLGLFGFFAHPALTASSPHHASGNWGLLDQSAALHWVVANISAFGGDPSRITIAGESAGSMSASAQMISPLSRGLISGVIGESGSILARPSTGSLKQAEEQGGKFAANLGLTTLEQLRSADTKILFEAAGKPGTPWFWPIVDGHFFPEHPREILKAGRQAQVPLLGGWNSLEQNPRAVLGREPATLANLKAAIERLFLDHAPAVLKAYLPATEAEAQQAATDLAGDNFIGHNTWQWLHLAAHSSTQPVYRYYYAHPRPGAQSATHTPEKENPHGPPTTQTHFARTPHDNKIT
ncbi:MAG: carboxylesterase/lipase family protein, partial [Acidobacteriota bacterium]